MLLTADKGVKHLCVSAIGDTPMLKNHTSGATHTAALRSTDQRRVQADSQNLEVASFRGDCNKSTRRPRNVHKKPTNQVDLDGGQ